MSCKYYYRGGLCANSQMEKPFCIGESDCEFLNKPQQSGDAVSAKTTIPELKLSTIIVDDKKQDDSMSQWMGVYCPHYQRFFCTGGTDGCKSGGCATSTDYENSLSVHMGKLK